MSGSSQPNPATALITGGSAGIGLDYADFLAGQGWNLVLTARRLDRLEQAAEQLTEKHGITCTAIAADLARREAPNELMAEIEQRDIAIDALINNAGYGLPTIFSTTEWEQVESFLEVMVGAATHLPNHPEPRSRWRERGSILKAGFVIFE